MTSEELKKYEAKREFDRTSEPRPEVRPGRGELVFVVQKHAARRLHYDFRLELDGVLKSWSVPNGPSPDPAVKRLAVMVEDHPLDYASFEGLIPRGEYGAGEVIVWDRGTYSPEAEDKVFFSDRVRAEALMRQGLEEGKVSIFLRGEKLRGSWTLVRMRTARDWLLIKHRDEFAQPERDILEEGRSVISGLGLDDLKAGRVPDLNLADIPGASPAPFPASVSPMLATVAEAPFSDPVWVFEPKLDGFRILSFIREGKAALRSRRGLDVTGEYPDVTGDLSRMGGETVLDGEMVAVDESGRSCFQCLQQRLGLLRGKNIPPLPRFRIVYYVFDILYRNGYDLRGVRLMRRKEVLRRVLAPSEHMRLIDFYEEDGPGVYEAAIRNGLEGTIAKLKDSVYETGRRSRSWLKIKAVQSGDFVIGGYTRGAGSRVSAFGSLLLGYYDDSGRLNYAGNVGSGFDEAALADLKARLDRIVAEGSSFTSFPRLNMSVTWARPELVAEVKFAEWTRDGYLRAPVFLRLREDKPPFEAKRESTHPSPVLPVNTPDPPPGEEDLVARLRQPGDGLEIEVEGHRLSLSKLGKELWPAVQDHPALTKRDLLVYLARMAPYLLPHLKARPLTFNRFPDGIHGEHFYQKHWSDTLPGFVRTVSLSSEHVGGFQDYIVCNNLATLLWLGQIADLELHTWFSRVTPEPERPDLSSFGVAEREAIDSLVNYPDFIVFDIDPYIYSGREAPGEEPELNRAAFARGSEIALRLKELLDSLSLSAFIKTSGRTGLHVFVPVFREYDYAAVRSAAETVSLFLLRKYPDDITTEWAVEKRRGKVFLDYNQNVRGKTLASVYSPRPSPEATVSMALRWDEVGKVYPTDFTMINAPERLAQTGDLWEGILHTKQDLKAVLRISPGR